LADLSPIIQAVELTALSVVTLAIPVFGGWLKQHLNWVQDQKLQADIGTGINEVDALAEDAAGLAYSWLVAHDASVRDPKMANAALDAGLTFLAKAGGAVIAASGLTPEVVGQKVAAKFGTLLASDPTVSISTATLQPAQSISLSAAPLPAAAPSPPACPIPSVGAKS